jgi:hypothetical protein
MFRGIGQAPEQQDTTFFCMSRLVLHERDARKRDSNAKHRLGTFPGITIAFGLQEESSGQTVSRQGC